MLKISEIPPTNHTVTMRLESRVVGPWVTELRRSCDSVLNEGRSLRLQFGEVEFLDQNGVALLSTLQSRGVSLVDCSPFVVEQLKANCPL
jgi:hypothetical protein